MPPLCLCTKISALFTKIDQSVGLTATVFSADDRERAFNSTVARLRNGIPEPKLGLYYRGVQERWKEGTRSRQVVVCISMGAIWVISIETEAGYACSWQVGGASVDIGCCDVVEKM